MVARLSPIIDTYLLMTLPFSQVKRGHHTSSIIPSVMLNLCAKLKNIWMLSHDESFPQNKALALALRRLSFSYLMWLRPEDRLMDVFIELRLST